jgi:methanogenic corrinoid protein MtbC1
MSALLTTTMQSMGEVVSQLKEKNLPTVKVLIGGAPWTRPFARRSAPMLMAWMPWTGCEK